MSRDPVVQIVEFVDGIVNPNESPWTVAMTVKVVELLVDAACAAHEVSYEQLMHDLPLAISQGKIMDLIGELGVPVVPLAGAMAEDLQKDIAEMKNEKLQDGA